MNKPPPSPAGSTGASTQRHDEAEPRLPHEHDESAASQSNAEAANSRTGRQAHDDVARGVVDTDRAPVVDAVYNQKIKPA